MHRRVSDLKKKTKMDLYLFLNIHEQLCTDGIYRTDNMPETIAIFAILDNQLFKMFNFKYYFDKLGLISIKFGHIVICILQPYSYTRSNSVAHKNNN